MSESHLPDLGDTFTLTLATMANGGKSVGRDGHDRAVFVPLTIPGETVRVEIVESKPRYAHADLLEVLQSSSDRIEPVCPHFGPCGGCHFQHISYQAQLGYKQSVVIDQLRRIGKMTEVKVNPTLANPEPYYYSTEVTFDLTDDGKLGFWSSSSKEVIPIEVCHIINANLQELFQQVDLTLPSLRRLMLRVGDDGSALAAMEVEGGEVPSLTADVPISVNLLLPDGTTVNLVGDNHTVRETRERSFRVTAGSFIFSSPAASEILVDTVLNYASLSDRDRVLELDSGVGLLTAFLAQAASEVVGVEMNPDSVVDLSTNLKEYDNVSIYQGDVEEILPNLSRPFSVLVAQPPENGLSIGALDEVQRLGPDKLIYIGSDIATMARDSRRLDDNGFQLVEVQPIDMWPQTYHTLTVSLWKRAS
jgi:23S rRNA (uracil1939-C5)-methyltransferase